jgi:hypothetical protein
LVPINRRQGSNGHGHERIDHAQKDTMSSEVKAGEIARSLAADPQTS